MTKLVIDRKKFIELLDNGIKKYNIDNRNKPINPNELKNSIIKEFDMYIAFDQSKHDIFDEGM